MAAGSSVVGPRLGRRPLQMRAQPSPVTSYEVVDSAPYLQAGPSDGQLGQSRPLPGMSSEREIDSQAMNLSAAEASAPLNCRATRTSLCAGLYGGLPEL